jgi:hypothetical protein
VSNDEAKIYGVIVHGKITPPAHRTGLLRPTTALPTLPVGVPASPGMRAKARSKPGALIRLCGDGAVCQMRRKYMGSLYTRKNHPSCTQNRAVPTHHRTPDAPRWRSRLALDVGEGQKQPRCIDSPVRRRGGVCQMMRRKYMGSLYTWKNHPSCTQNRAVPTHHRTPDAPRWRSRLALDVGEGQKQTRCIDTPVRRRGGVSNDEAKIYGVIIHTEKSPLMHTENRAVPTHHRTADAPRWRSRLALDVGEGQKQTRCIDSPVRRRVGVK